MAHQQIFFRDGFKYLFVLAPALLFLVSCGGGGGGGAHGSVFLNWVRSEERRVGKECPEPCSYRWWVYL